MRKRTRDPAKRGTGIAIHRVVPARVACGIGAGAQAGERNAWLAVVSIALGTSRWCSQS
jgi:hypothetical protein